MGKVNLVKVYKFDEVSERIGKLIGGKSVQGSLNEQTVIVLENLDEYDAFYHFCNFLWPTNPEETTRHYLAQSPNSYAMSYETFLRIIQSFWSALAKFRGHR